jgi:hypothetical protein
MVGELVVLKMSLGCCGQRVRAGIAYMIWDRSYEIGIYPKLGRGPAGRNFPLRPVE